MGQLEGRWEFRVRRRLSRLEIGGGTIDDIECEQ